jgi:hypothetical protein
VRRIRLGVFIPTFTEQAFDRDTRFAQCFKRNWIGFLVLTRAAASGVRLKATFAQVIERGLCQDASRRVVRAQEKNIQGLCFIAHINFPMAIDN